MSAFIEEVMRMRHFSDQHVLSMIGLVIERNMPMIVMPFMSSGDLRTYVANPKLVSLEQCSLYWYLIREISYHSSKSDLVVDVFYV